MAQSVTKYKYKGKTGTIMLLVEEQANKIVSVYNQNVLQLEDISNLIIYLAMQ